MCSGRSLVLIGGFVLVGAAGFLAGHHLGGPTGIDSAWPTAVMQVQQEQETDDAAMWAQMAALTAPGPEHERMAKYAGSFDATIKSMMGPEAETSTGTCTNEMILGGRYMVSKFKGTVGEMEFEGCGISGYDKVQKKYIGLWMDTMGTSFMLSEGQWDEAAGKMVMHSESVDPATGAKVKSREETTYPDDDTQIFTMFMPGPDGQVAPVLEITYKRKK